MMAYGVEYGVLIMCYEIVGNIINALIQLSKYSYIQRT